MDRLLRDPRKKAPPPLTQGDEVLFSQLDRGIREFYQSARSYWPPAADPGTAAPSTSVFITTTVMSGETSRFTGDFGTLVPDVDHHGLFTGSARREQRRGGAMLPRQNKTKSREPAISHGR